jgi:threonine/homoserine/homoserine lactone efflux protein
VDPAFALRGYVLGFTIAAAVGPISLLVMRRTLAEGRLIGFASGLGVATADATYGAIAAFGLGAITDLLVSARQVLGLVGGVFLLWLAWKTVRASPTDPAAAPEPGRRGGAPGAYLSILGLTLANPMTILAFGALFAGLGVTSGSTGDAALIVLGVLLGSSAWWLVNDHGRRRRPLPPHATLDPSDQRRVGRRHRRLRGRRDRPGRVERHAALSTATCRWSALRRSAPLAENPAMPITARQLNRATLRRQLLLEREPLGVVEAVRRVAAIQAQEPASPYLALWNRIADFDPADLDAAFADRSVVKASLIRLTLHAVDAGDYAAFHDAMLSSLRASRLNDARFTTTALATADIDALVPHLVEFAARPRSKAEIEAMLRSRLGERHDPRAWWALKSFAPLHHAPTGGPWSFRTAASFIDARKAPDAVSPDEAVQRLVLRYLEGFGPASIADFAQFTMLRRPVTREAIQALAGQVVELEGPDRTTLFDLPGAPIPDEETPAPPRLLPMWDSVLLAYADRSRLIPPDYRRVVIRQNGDVLPTLLIDGHVAGVWRPVDGGIEATAFHKLSGAAWRGLEMEAAALVAFLADREPIVYRRYAHWWATLPSAEVRLLSG